MASNIILNTDSYKASHFVQYPPNTSGLSCYIESRGGQFDRTVFFGLQLFLREHLTKPITTNDIDEAQSLITAHGLPFNREGWEYIVKEHGGFLPVEIEAVAEGSVIPTHNVLLQIKNTDPACFWLPTYLETALLRAIWYPTTVATLSWHCRKILRYFLEQTADDSSTLPWLLHDFGARGTSSLESARIGGLAHLVSFSGTDTLCAIDAAKEHYGEPMAGFSIPAAEHSAIISWGKDHEADAYKHIFQQFSGEDKSVSIVSDSYDICNAVDNIWGKELHDMVATNAGRLVIRPDSGDPMTIVVRVINSLMEKFGHRTNSRGYRVLPDNIRVIQGDGVNIDSIAACCDTLKDNKISTENVVFGMGGALLQRVNRDTQRFAMKASAIKREDGWVGVHKEPITDPMKTSKAGRLALCYDDSGQLETVQESEQNGRANLLQPVYRNGRLLREDSLKEIRQRAVADDPVAT